MVVKNAGTAAVRGPALSMQLCGLGWVTSHFCASVFTKWYLSSLKYEVVRIHWVKHLMRRLAHSKHSIMLIINIMVTLSLNRVFGTYCVENHWSVTTSEIWIVKLRLSWKLLISKLSSVPFKNISCCCDSNKINIYFIFLSAMKEFTSVRWLIQLFITSQQTTKFSCSRRTYFLWHFGLAEWSIKWELFSPHDKKLETGWQCEADAAAAGLQAARDCFCTGILGLSLLPYPSFTCCREPTFQADGRRTKDKCVSWRCLGFFFL